MRLAVAAVCITLLLVGCSSSSPEQSPSTSSGNSAVTFEQVSDPAGFSFQKPAGWTFSSDAKSGRIDLQGQNGEQVVLWPIVSSAPFQPSGAIATLQGMAARIWPDVQWQKPEAAGQAAIRAFGQSSSGKAVAVLSWVNGAGAGAGYLFAASAPADRYAVVADTAATIFKSFRIAGSSSKQAAGLSYTTWQDPQEKAFSLEVPAQWQVTGGTVRAAPTDIRSGVGIASPDGRVFVIIGDPNQPIYKEPSALLTQLGYPEGSTYPLGFGVNVIMRRHQPGVTFVTDYARNVVGRSCPGVQVQSSKDRPEAVAALDAALRQFSALGVGVSNTAGEVTFTCTLTQPINGYYFAVTQLTQAQAGSLWTVDKLFGYLATPDAVGTAQTVLDHALKTFQINPDWERMQQNIALNTSKILAKSNQDISNIIASNWDVNKGDAQFRRISNGILGVVDVADPETGRQFKVGNDANYGWIDHSGNIVGTQTDARPNSDFRALTRIP